MPRINSINPKNASIDVDFLQAKPSSGVAERTTFDLIEDHGVRHA